MYDTVNFRLMQAEVEESLIDTIPQYLERCSEHLYNQRDLVITGELGNLSVSLSKSQIKVKDGSLCKWHLGDNYKTLGRTDAKDAIEHLADTLHLPFTKADVIRLDVAQNIIVKHPIEVYLNHLGIMKGATRLIEPSGLYYKFGDITLCFYDKNKEQKNRNELVGVLYEGRNVMRYEQRFMARIAKNCKAPFVIASTLYDEDFYMKVLDAWKDSYQSINKINDVSLNFRAMKTKEQMKKMAVLYMLEKQGGKLEALNHITEQQKKGELSRKQASDLRKLVEDVYNIDADLIVPNDAIIELDKKINEAVRFYR